MGNKKQRNKEVEKKEINKKKFLKKQLITHVLSISSGIIITILTMGISDLYHKPKTWTDVNSAVIIENGQYANSEQDLNNLKDISSTESSDYLNYENWCEEDYPYEIYLNSENRTFDIADQAFIINMYVSNNSDNELLFNNLFLKVKQFTLNVPIVSAKVGIVDNSYFIKINNLTHKNIEKLILNISDEDNFIFKYIGQIDNVLVENLEAFESKDIKLFDLSEMHDKEKINDFIPIIKLKDNNENILSFKFNKLFRDSMPKADGYTYDMSRDIEYSNSRINLYKVEDTIPSHQVYQLQLLTYFDKPCAISLNIQYYLNEKKYEEDLRDIIIYNPLNENMTSYKDYFKDIQYQDSNLVKIQ